MVWSVKFCFFFKFNFWWALLGDHTRNSLIVSWKSFRWKMALCAMSEENGPFFAQFSQNSLQQFALFPHVTYKFRANINESLTDSWLKSFFLWFFDMQYAISKNLRCIYLAEWAFICFVPGPMTGSTSLFCLATSVHIRAKNARHFK